MFGFLAPGLRSQSERSSVPSVSSMRPRSVYSSPRWAGRAQQYFQALGYFNVAFSLLNVRTFSPSSCRNRGRIFCGGAERNWERHAMWFVLALAIFLPVGVGFWAMKRGFTSRTPLDGGL